MDGVSPEDGSQGQDLKTAAVVRTEAAPRRQITLSAPLKPPKRLFSFSLNASCSILGSQHCEQFQAAPQKSC